MLLLLLLLLLCMSITHYPHGDYTSGVPLVVSGAEGSAPVDVQMGVSVALLSVLRQTCPCLSRPRAIPVSPVPLLLLQGLHTGGEEAPIGSTHR